MGRLISSFLFLAIFIILFLASCAMDASKQNELKPTAYSKINELTVVADEELWKGMVGDTFRHYFSAPYLILPSPESIFDLRYFSPRKIQEERIFRSLRNYVILADLSDTSSLASKMVKADIGHDKYVEAMGDSKINTSVGKDRWANGQRIFYLYSNSQAGLSETIKKGFPAVRNKLYEIEAPRIKATAYQGGELDGLENKIFEKFGAKMDIPKGYVVAVEEDNFLWLRRETKGVSSSLLLTTIPYKNESQLSDKGIRSARDTLGYKFVSSNAANSYMKTNDVDLPMFSKKTTANGSYAVETHGIWEMENDFMGGPFVNLAVVNEQKGELFMIDGFIFAPGEKKRNHMQYLDIILKTVQF